MSPFQCWNNKDQKPDFAIDLHAVRSLLGDRAAEELKKLYPCVSRDEAGFGNGLLQPGNTIDSMSELIANKGLHSFGTIFDDSFCSAAELSPEDQMERDKSWTLQSRAVLPTMRWTFCRSGCRNDWGSARSLDVATPRFMRG